MKGGSMRAYLGRLSILAVAAALVLAGGVRADEEKVPLEKVPRAVLAAVKKRFPKSELVEAARETEGGKTVYEITIKAGGAKIDLTVTPKGTITTIEKEVPVASLPAAVKDAVNKKYPKATWKLAEEVIQVKGGKETFAYYEAHLVTAGKKKVEVKVRKDGTIVAEEKEEKKEDKREKKEARRTERFALPKS
jgi:hypothetical protein